MKDVSKLSIEDITECFKIYNETGESQMYGDILGRIAELWNEIPVREPTVKQLKKQIKHSKNPLEIKTLNRKLNEMYKKKGSE